MSDALDWLLAVRPGPMQAYFSFLKQAGGSLDPKTRSLISVITKVGAQTERGFRQYLKRALRDGATADEVIDALLMAFPLLGFSKIVWAVDQLIAMDLPEFDRERLAGMAAASADDLPPAVSADTAEGRAGARTAPGGKGPSDGVAGVATAPDGSEEGPVTDAAAWADIGALDDFPAHDLAHVRGPGGGCFVRRVEGGVNVFRANCPHKDTPLTLADLNGKKTCIRCPRHDWRFDAVDGSPRNAESAALPLPPLPRRVVNGRLEVLWPG